VKLTRKFSLPLNVVMFAPIGGFARLSGDLLGTACGCGNQAAQDSNTTTSPPYFHHHQSMDIPSLLGAPFCHTMDFDIYI
jgi:hypothetical protein